ncbi:HIT-like domain-containing protein [Microdochium trichocladiopsis]|uniref:HIT-like domain-containing protein n=1 Tax=Microdochium trichocladiopsis TaxID=1682393 RepID=A0A9P8YEC2_9PEZI|nr:HIT-like domain-containing protein [Microdochium trichocladiopsis]KAH7035397.1 HIT-like domain-containing protein [Microdochium trichocladiopsis]
MATTEESKRRAEELVPRFQFEKVLNHDGGGRRITLLGAIDQQPALLILDRAPLPDAEEYLSALPSNLRSLANLGNNDIYSWFLASGGPVFTVGDGDDNTSSNNKKDKYADFKIDLIWPCTDKHIKKHSRQGARAVHETPQIYADHVRPLMEASRAEGRLNWVYNIIEGRKEVEDVIYRTPLGRDGDEGFLMLPNLHWDRTTTEALHLLGIVERRDLWSLRDLRKKHIPWLRHMKAKMVDATVATYPEIEADQLKLFVHYHPTYYHFHIHVVHVMLEPTGTQGVGKAVGLDSIIEQLEGMQGDEETGMDTVTMNYTVGEASELWTDVFLPLKLKTSGKSSLQQ